MFTTANYQRAKWIHTNCYIDAVTIKKTIVTLQSPKTYKRLNIK